MKTTMIAFAASTAVATAAVKEASSWVLTVPPAEPNSKCYTEASAPAKEKWTATYECKKLCGPVDKPSYGLPGDENNMGDCGPDLSGRDYPTPATSGEYPARVKCVGTWQTVTPKCGDEEEKYGRIVRPTCTAAGTAEKTLNNEFKCLNQDGDDFPLDADKCGVPTFLTGDTPLTKTALDAAIETAEVASKAACDTANAFSAGSCLATIKTKTCKAIPKCVPTMWVQTNRCKNCGQAATTDEAKTYKCVDQKGDEIAADSNGECGGAKPTDKQSCSKTDECDTYPACPLASGAEKVAMTAAVAIAAIAMF